MNADLCDRVRFQPRQDVDSNDCFAVTKQTGSFLCR
jgi:hypothetical protein